MDKQFAQSNSAVLSQFSTSKSFSSTSFAASKQTASLQQSFQQDLGEDLFSKFSSRFDRLPNDFESLTIQNSDPRYSDTSLAFSKPSLIRENFPQTNLNFSDSNFTNISLKQCQSSQYSNRSITSTVSSKVIRKKIVRKIVNGEIVEEEEEIDEIENEPVTEQIVIENSSNDVSKSASIKTGKISEFLKSSNLPEIKSKPEPKSKLKAIEVSADRTNKLKSIFGFGKKKKKEAKDIGIIQPIINELLQTEEKYIDDLRLVVDHLMPELKRLDAPKELQDDGKYLLFGNIEIIFMFHDVQFLTDLKEIEKTPEDIANCFLKHRKEFSLYRHYNRNQPQSEIYAGKYGLFFKNKIAELQQLPDIRNFLIKPTQRLCKYSLLMEQLLKECKKHKLDAEDVKIVKEAYEMLKAEIRLGNDLMALDAIKECQMDLKDQGDLIYRDPFVVKRGNDGEFKAMVFLFEKIMLFTKTKLENNVDVLYYQDFIYLKDIGLTECPNDSKTFKVWFHKHTLKPYTLKTDNKELKNKWVEEIRKQLQNELERSKEQQNVKRTLIDLKDIVGDKTKATNKKK